MTQLARQLEQLLRITVNPLSTKIMPTYTSACPKCGKVYEFKASVAERIEKRPECCGQKTEGVIHAVPGKVDKPAA